MADRRSASDEPEAQGVEGSPGEAPAPRLLQVTVVTGDRPVYQGEASRVVAPSTYGQIAILPGHMALLAALEPGEVIVRRGEDEPEVDMAIGGGFIEVREDEVIILADSAERAEEIDVDRAEAARQRAEQAMRRYRGTPEYAAAARALSRSTARLKVAQRARTRR